MSQFHQSFTVLKRLFPFENSLVLNVYGKTYNLMANCLEYALVYAS